MLLHLRATPDPTHTIKPTAFNRARHEMPRSNALDLANPKFLPRPPHDRTAPIPSQAPFESHHIGGCMARKHKPQASNTPPRTRTPHSHAPPHAHTPTTPENRARNARPSTRHALLAERRGRTNNTRTRARNARPSMRYALLASAAIA